MPRKFPDVQARLFREEMRPSGTWGQAGKTPNSREEKRGICLLARAPWEDSGLAISLGQNGGLWEEVEAATLVCAIFKGGGEDRAARVSKWEEILTRILF